MPLIDVNSASYQDLKKVPGIGDAIIPRILAARPFRDIKDLRKRVAYIGEEKEKTLPMYICFGAQSAPSVNTQRSECSPARQQVRSESASAPMMVDINNASIAELCTLRGIKIAKAELIAAARPFRCVDDLMGVRGIKAKVLDGFRNRIQVGEYHTAATATEASPSAPIISTISTVSTMAAEWRTHQYVGASEFYDYSDDGETSGDDSSDLDDENDADCDENNADEAARVTTAGREPTDDADADFEEYLRQCREQSEPVEFTSNEWISMESHLEAPAAMSSVSPPPDDRFPVCCALTHRIRELVRLRQEQHTVRGSVDHRYRVWTPPESSCRSPVILLASWNVRNVSKKKSACFLEKIADVIDEFDVVALQEVRDKRVLIKLKRYLSSSWSFLISEPVGSLGGRQEHYAFLYRKNIVQPTDMWELDTVTDPDVLRPPFVVHFRSVPGSGLAQPLELTLVNVHVCFGHVRERQKEISAIRSMADELAHQIPVTRRNVVVLGDFNVGPVEALGGTDSALVALIRPPLATTVFGHLYDNIWMDPIALSRTQSGVKVEACGVSRIDWRYYPLLKPDDESDASRESAALPEEVAAERFRCAVELSDHCPVWAAFSTAPSTTTWAA